MKFSFSNSLHQAVLLSVLSIILGVGSNLVRTEKIPWLEKKLDTGVIEDLEDISQEQVLIAISLEQAKNLHDKEVLFIDARDTEYYLEGHIAGAWQDAFLLELSFNIESRQEKNAPIVVYCSDDGCGDSEELAYDLQSMGYSKLYVFKGGWLSWSEAGFPIESGE